MTDPDAALVAAVQEGDTQALSVLYRRYVELVFRYVRRRVPTTELAEDVTSETFLAIVTGLRTFRGSSSFRTWMFQIARRRIADHWRRHYELPECAIDLVLDLIGAPHADHEPDPDVSMRSNIDLKRVLAELSERDRRVLECRFFKQKSVRETAEELSLSEGNVKVIQHRALRQAAGIAQRL